MADWVALSAQWLKPIYRQMYRELLSGGYVQADETPVRCNDSDEKRGGTTQGWLWVISRPGGEVVFDWRLSRRHGELTSLLHGYRTARRHRCRVDAEPWRGSSGSHPACGDGILREL